MLGHKRLLIVIITMVIITLLNAQTIFGAKQPTQQFDQAEVQKLLDQTVKQADSAFKAANDAIRGSNVAVALAHNALQTAKESFAISKATSQLAREVTVELERVKHLPASLELQARDVLEQCTGKIIAKADEQRAILEAIKKECTRPLSEELEINKQKIKELFKNIGEPKFLIKIAAAIIVIALCIYILKYGLPILIDYLTRPRVISETSRKGPFDWFKPKQTIDISNLIFAPSLQKQLLQLLSRVQTAKKYNESLPNILFYGAPGTGKTAFVRALAYSSGLDYALTSGSEFAKITDLNQANNELRKLLNWAKGSKNGLIIFIDEAESLFANRRLSTTSKATQDFINTFLSLISDQSQKNVMFILSTNHPFKLDDSIANRIGINIEFTLPEAHEREKILLMYLVKFAQENENAVVDLDPEINLLLPTYADSLNGFSPRAIKFIAEEMIINARRQEPKHLTDKIAQASIYTAKCSLQQATQWKKERDEWTTTLTRAVRCKG